MKLDENGIADTVLALLAAYSFGNGRAWKDFDFGMRSPVRAGIYPRMQGQDKSLYLTDEGLKYGQAHAQVLFAARVGVALRALEPAHPFQLIANAMR